MSLKVAYVCLILGAALMLNVVYGQNAKSDFEECDPKGKHYSPQHCLQLRSQPNALYQRLFRYYNEKVLPVSNSRDVILIRSRFSLLDILDVSDNAVNVHGWLYLDWNDRLLNWNPDDYGYIPAIRLPKSKIWVPDIVQFNSKSTDSEDSNDEDVYLYSNGHAIRVLDKQYSSICNLDLRFFPFDTQACDFVFGSWVFSTHQVVLENISSVVETDYYNSNSNWHLLTTSVSKINKTYGTPDSYTTLKYTITIQRNCCNYIFSIILPIVILTIFTLLIFLIPLEWPVLRLGFSIFVTLGIFLLLFYIQEFVAAGSVHTPLISIYLTVLLIIAALTVVFNIVLIYLNLKSGDVPDALKKVIKCDKSTNEHESEWRSFTRCLDTILFLIVLVVVLITAFIFIMLAIFM